MNNLVQEILEMWELDYDASTLTRELKWQIVIARLRELQIQIIGNVTGTEYPTTKELLGKQHG